MTVEYLNEFLILVKTQNFANAAAQLYMNQSTLSKHIKSLEKELGVELFDRTTRKVTLTSYGEHLLPYAYEIYNQSYRYLTELSQKKNNVISIGAIPSLSHYGIVDVIMNFKLKHEEYVVTIDEADSTDLYHRLLNHEYEIAFLRNFNPYGSINTKNICVNIIPYCKDNVVALIPKEHHLANKKSVTISELKDEKLCLLKEHTMLYDVCMEAFRDAGIIPNIYYTSHRAENLIEMSEKCGGITILMGVVSNSEEMSKKAIYILNDKFNVVPLFPEITSTIALTYLRGAALSPSARKFIDYFNKEVIKN
ncbi:MAG: LysR family transcriptional regulator [Lachnospiraceae bacterium]|nr:LysR family transcriptional regulator [Lachnospiraceae bacterium]